MTGMDTPQFPDGSHEDHERRARLAYETYWRTILGGECQPDFQYLTPMIQVAWLKLAGVIARDTLTRTADRYDGAGLESDWVQRLRDDAGEALCLKLPPPVPPSTKINYSRGGL